MVHPLTAQVLPDILTVCGREGDTAIGAVVADYVDAVVVRAQASADPRKTDIEDQPCPDPHNCPHHQVD